MNPHKNIWVPTMISYIYRQRKFVTCMHYMLKYNSNNNGSNCNNNSGNNNSNIWREVTLWHDYTRPTLSRKEINASNSKQRTIPFLLSVSLFVTLHLSSNNAYTRKRLHAPTFTLNSIWIIACSTGTLVPFCNVFLPLWTDEWEWLARDFISCTWYSVSITTSRNTRNC